MSFCYKNHINYKNIKREELSYEREEFGKKAPRSKSPVRYLQANDLNKYERM